MVQEARSGCKCDDGYFEQRASLCSEQQPIQVVSLGLLGYLPMDNFICIKVFYTYCVYSFPRAKHDLKTAGNASCLCVFLSHTNTHTHVNGL